MKLVALMPVRNESWVLGLSLRVALRWCDTAIVLDHGSVDETPHIIADVASEYPGRVRVLAVREDGWQEMTHRQILLDAARADDATHCAIVDADEVLTGDLLDSIRAHVEQLPPGAMLQVPMRNMYGSADTFRDDESIWGRAMVTTTFGLAPGLQWVAANGYQHHHREPYGATNVYRIYRQQISGGVMHLQFSSRRRLLAKHAWYQMHETLTYPAKPRHEIAALYSMAPDWTGARIVDAPAAWWKPYAGIREHLDLDREPWHEGECRRLVEAYGRERFAGLNLFGVI